MLASIGADADLYAVQLHQPLTIVSHGDLALTWDNARNHLRHILLLDAALWYRPGAVQQEAYFARICCFQDKCLVPSTVVGVST
jgi:hypothetical protein